MDKGPKLNVYKTSILSTLLLRSLSANYIQRKLFLKIAKVCIKLPRAAYSKVKLKFKAWSTTAKWTPPHTEKRYTVLQIKES